MATKAKAAVATEPILNIEPEDMLVMLGQKHLNDAVGDLIAINKDVHAAIQAITVLILKEVKAQKEVLKEIEL